MLTLVDYRIPLSMIHCRKFNFAYYFQLLNHLTPFGPFVKAVSGNRVSALLNVEGKVCQFGKFYVASYYTSLGISEIFS